MRRRLTLAVLGATFLLAGCGGARAPQAGSRVTHDRNLITADEIATISATNAYDVVKRLRPQFLQSRGSNTFDPTPALPVVYLDGVRFGDVSALRGIDVGRIASIRFLSGPEAQQRFGTDNVAGVILVATKS